MGGRTLYDSWGSEMQIRNTFVPSAITTLLILFTTTAGPARADVTGSILGIVHDASGAVIAGATVTATNAGTNQTRSTTSDVTGEYRLLALPVGRYTIEATQPGFQKFITTDIDLREERARQCSKRLGQSA